MNWTDEQIKEDVIKLVNKYGLEGGWENIQYMEDDQYKWYMKIFYKSIYKGIT